MTRMDNLPDTTTPDEVWPSSPPPALYDARGTDIVLMLRLAILRVGDALPDYAGDAEALGNAVARLDALTSDLRAVTTEAKRMMSDAMPTKELNLDGVGTFTKSPASSKHTWDHDKTALAVIREAWEAGRINHPDDAAAVLKEAAGISYWRATYLKDHGMDPSDFRESEYGSPSVRITANSFRAAEKKGSKS